MDNKIEIITHRELVEFGRRWLSSRSPVVVTELASAAGETPDIIAFETRIKNIGYDMGYGSILIECKASRSDFLVDCKKYYRRSAYAGMGNFRYYLAPAGLIKTEELPERWGLLEASRSGRISIRHISERQESDKSKEISLLISVMRRLKIDDGNHISLRVYTHETKNNATLTINTEVPIEHQTCEEDTENIPPAGA